MQLDLFADSLDTRLRNDLTEALEQRDGPRASLAHAALQAERPRDALLEPAERLVDGLAHFAGAQAPFSTAKEAAAARRHLDEQLAPAAQAVFRDRAGDWVRPCWCSLAERAAALPWDAEQPDAHAAALWLQAGDATSAAAATEAIASWHRIPAPLAWMAQARCRSAGLDAAWPLIAELAWLAPQRVAPCVAAAADPLLSRLYGQFEDSLDAGPEWFPAWLLIAHPALLPRLREARAGLDTEPERGCRLLISLLRLERQGRQADVIGPRKRLRELHPDLFAIYMAAR